MYLKSSRELGSLAMAAALGLSGKPFAAKPFAAKPFAAKPFAAKPFAAKPFAAKPFAAKPFAAKPFAAKPFAAKPFAAKPFDPTRASSVLPTSSPAIPPHPIASAPTAPKVNDANIFCVIYYTSFGDSKTLGGSVTASCHLNHGGTASDLAGDGETDVKCRPRSHLRLERHGASVAIHHDRARHRKPLPASTTHLLRREEGIKDLSFDGLRNAHPRVADVHDHRVRLGPRADADLAALLPVTTPIGDRMHGIEKNLEERLIQIVGVPADQRHGSIVGQHVGDGAGL